MKRIVHACLLIGILSASDLRADWFNTAVPDNSATPPAVSPTSQPTTRPLDAQYVIGGSHATVVKSLEQAIDSIQKQMDELAASGETADHNALADILGKYQTTLKRTKESPVPPSIYPLQLGKKGCLYLVRKAKAPGGTPGKPRTMDIHVMAWMKVKILRIEQDQSISAELLDTFGKLCFYKVVIEGLPSTLKVGSVVQLINMQFECVMEERADSGKVYYLKKL